MGSFLSELECWIATGQGAYACAVCATSLIEASRNPALLDALRHAAINLPDGVPVAWTLSALYGRRQERLAGPTAMMAVLELASSRGYRVLLFGSTPEVQAALADRIRIEFPGATVADCIAPPFRPLSSAEDSAIIRRIRDKSPDIVLVSLGAPKQELWMRRHASVLGIPAIGVGAAFEYYVGVIRRAPQWMQRSGLEWAFRLVQQPRSLGYRFASTLPLFALRATAQVISRSLQPRGPRNR
jgi:N-acetylglucosaminyldiphosphoundecaprenol N-acetyl-beta-D-mannosaminyltransferase